MMSDDEIALLRETARGMFLEQRELATRDLPAFWSLLSAHDMSLVGTDEALGGHGGTAQHRMVLLQEAGRTALSAPALEGYLASLLLAGAGAPLTDAPAAIVLDAPVSVDQATSVLEFSARRPVVAWGSAAARVLVVAASAAGTHLVAVDQDKCTWTRGSNIAGEPRDRLEVVEAPGEILGPLTGDVLSGVRRAAVVGRAAQMQGAAERALEQTVEHVRARQQFGRPLARLQAVQQSVATMAGAVAAGGAAVAAATAALLRPAADSHADHAGHFAVAACRVQLIRTATEVYRTAHQLHGAIGFTDEHSLHLVTTRLMSWSTEAPTLAETTRWLGRLVRSEGDAWRLLTGT